jgi:2,5-furandicarboxylate decarboxylase 1
MAALSVMDLKHVVVVDDDIDVNNPTEVEWAIATRVQGDRDVIIIPGARAKPLDPSLYITPGQVPTGAKVGIDATIGEGIPKERFERISYAYFDSAKIADYVAGKSDAGAASPAGALPELTKKIAAMIESAPLYYSELAERLSEYDFATLARAFGQLHADGLLWQDPRGRICLKGSKFAAKP